MGSLLPGWDERSPGVAPKGFQDYNENEDEDIGYFAAYAKLKKLQKEGGEPTSPIDIRRSASLSRRSSFEPRTSPRALLSRASMPSGGTARDWAPMSPQGPSRSLVRAETMAAGPGFRPSSQASGSGGVAPPNLQRMYSMPMTRGERSDVLAGLVPTSPSGFSNAPRTPSLDAYKTHQEDKPDYQWWRHLDSSALNERPDEPESKEKGYTPQYGVTGQGIHFHRGDTEGPAIIPAH